ncbi:endonuclease-reverse transcriptase [Lasius niger]|uniref:Endonuclease-reverse transcriptase n=1 Tax=Lasius niger TaxID=67767 RepID=A0A0J7KK61_LASNI|nr:endonuclease-reverse transcriptase [Lasius niger]
MWTILRNTIQMTAQQLSASPASFRKPWISDETWQVILRRREVKNTADQRTYANLSDEIKRRCRKYKEHYIAQICEEIEYPAHHNEF